MMVLFFLYQALFFVIFCIYRKIEKLFNYTVSEEALVQISMFANKNVFRIVPKSNLDLITALKSERNLIGSRLTLNILKNISHHCLTKPLKFDEFLRNHFSVVF